MNAAELVPGPLTSDDLRARHRPGAVINRIGPDFGKAQCDRCCRVWPCDAGILLATVDRLRAEANTAYRQGLIDGADSVGREYDFGDDEDAL